MGDLEEFEAFEAAMAQVFGETANGESINYVMFRSTVQHMVRSAVPEWYHVSIMKCVGVGVLGWRWVCVRGVGAWLSYGSLGVLGWRCVC